MHISHFLDSSSAPSPQGIYKLPPEVLLQIFMLTRQPLIADSSTRPVPVIVPKNYRRRYRYYRAGFWEGLSRGSPWSLIRVCHEWRTLAVEYPPLWSSVVLSPLIHAADVPLLRCQMEWSQNAPLSVMLWFSRTWRSDWEHLQKLLPQISLSASRWRLLKIVVGCDSDSRSGWEDSPQEVAGQFIASLSSTDMPLLEQLMLVGPGASCITTDNNHAFAQKAPRLTRVVLGEPTISDPQIQVSLPWPQLTMYKANHKLKFNWLHAMAPSLVEVDLSFYQESIYGNTAIHFPCLRRLVVMDQGLLDSFTAPNLAELCIAHAGYLETIEDILSFLRRSERFTLETLKLIEYMTTVPLLISLLKQLPNLRTLALHCYKVTFEDDDEDYEPLFSMTELIPALVAQPHDDRILCPLLTSVSLGDLQGLLIEGGLRPAFVEMARSRSPEGVCVRDGRCASLQRIDVYGKRVGLGAAAYKIRSMGIRVETSTGRAARQAVDDWRHY